MKITIEIVCDDPKEAARTMQALANRIDSLPADNKPAKTTTRAQTKEKPSKPYPPLVEPDEPTDAEIESAAADLTEDIQEPAIAPEQTETDATPTDRPTDGAKKPWCRKFPNGCKICGTTERKHMGGGKCTTCYFK